MQRLLVSLVLITSLVADFAYSGQTFNADKMQVVSVSVQALNYFTTFESALNALQANYPKEDMAAVKAEFQRLGILKAKLPHLTLHENDVKMQGESAPIKVVDLKQFRFSFKGIQWTFDSHKPLHENLLQIERVFKKANKSNSAIVELFAPSAYADWAGLLETSHKLAIGVGLALGCAVAIVIAAPAVAAGTLAIGTVTLAVAAGLAVGGLAYYVIDSLGHQMFDPKQKPAQLLPLSVSCRRNSGDAFHVYLASKDVHVLYENGKPNTIQLRDLQNHVIKTYILDPKKGWQAQDANGPLKNPTDDENALTKAVIDMGEQSLDPSKCQEMNKTFDKMRTEAKSNPAGAPAANAH